MQLPDKMDDELLAILGMPNFACGTLAQVLRDEGVAIPPKSEQEQAHVIFKLLSLYAEHGLDWQKHAADWIDWSKRAADHVKAIIREKDSG